jgi:undecaprenyl-diphosphatase
MAAVVAPPRAPASASPNGSTAPSRSASDAASAAAATGREAVRTAVGRARQAAGTVAAAATSATAERPVAAPIAAAVAPPRIAVARSRTAETVALAGLAGFGVLFALVKQKRTAAFDTALTLRIQAQRHATIDRVMAAASWPGFPPQSRVIPPTIIASLAAAGLRKEALCETAAWGSALVSTVAKSFMGRQRPVAGKDLRVVAAPLGGSSFPSGHVLTFVGTYGFLAVLAESLVRPRLARRLLVGGLVGLIALVGPSRIQQGHHWPTDVTASYLLGTSYLVAVTALYRRLKSEGGRIPAATPVEVQAG